MVTGQIAGKAGEDLGFACQTAKGAGVENPCCVAGKRGSIGMRRFGKLTVRKVTAFFCCDSAGQRGGRH